MTDVGWIPLGVVIIAALIAAGTDLWQYRVYNMLTLPLILSGMLYHAVQGGWLGLGFSSLGMLFGFSVLILPHLLGLMGAGDVKLMAGIGAWLGLSMTGYVFATTAIAAGFVSIVLILYRGELQESWAIIKMIVGRLLIAPAYIDKDDFVSVVANGPDRRLRAIPFAAMVPVGLAVALLLPFHVL